MSQTPVRPEVADRPRQLTATPCPTPPDPKPPKSDARISGMVATVALMLMFAFTALVVWLAA